MIMKTDTNTLGDDEEQLSCSFQEYEEAKRRIESTPSYGEPWLINSNEEPWKIWDSTRRCVADLNPRKRDHSHGMTISIQQAARAAQCVNACRGIVDPVEAIKEAREALEDTLTLLERADFSHGVTDSSGYDEGNYIAEKYMKRIQVMIAKLNNTAL